MSLPTSSKAMVLTAGTTGLVGLGMTAGFVAAGLSEQSKPRPPSSPWPRSPIASIVYDDTGPQPPEVSSPIDALLPTLFNATEAAFARCFSTGTVPEPGPGMHATIGDCTSSVVYQAAVPLAQAGQGPVTQAIDQLSCPPLDETGPLMQNLSIITAAFLEQLRRLVPPMLPAPAPAPHTGASVRLAADVVGTMALTMALHTLGLF